MAGIPSKEGAQSSINPKPILVPSSSADRTGDGVSTNENDSKSSSTSLQPSSEPSSSSVGSRPRRKPNPYSKETLCCDFCNRKFATKQGLQRHYVNSHQKTTMPFPCGDCDRRFTLKAELADHMKTTTHPKDFKSRDYACGFCRQKFFTEEQREDHWQTHYQNPKPHTFAIRYSVHPCQECGKKFPSKEFCMAHLRKYETNESALKRLGCSVCGKRFRAQQNLDWHEEFHKEQQVKPFDCKLCEIRFESEKLLQRHLESEFHATKVKSNVQKVKEESVEIKSEVNEVVVAEKEDSSSDMEASEIKVEREIQEVESILGLPYELQ